MLEQFTAEVVESPEPTEGSISVRIVPYSTPVEHAGRTIQFDPGSLTVPEDKVVPLTVDHGDGVTERIGKLTRILDADDGLYGNLSISDTRLGTDMHQLLRDGVVTDVSAGVEIDPEAETSKDGVLHRAGTLNHVSIVGAGAFGHVGSNVLAVHNQETEEPDMSEDTTPDVVTEDFATKTDIEELSAQIAKLEVPKVESRARGHQYANMGDLLNDVQNHARQKDPAATERLTHLIEMGVVDPRGTVVNFAFNGPAVSGTDGAGVTYDTYIPDLLTLLREGRPVANQFGSRQLPAEGENVVLPKVTQGATVDYQATQGTTVASQNVVTDSDSFPKSTLAGGQGVSIQAQQWSNPSYIDEVVRDHVAAYSEKLDFESINGDGATPNATAYTGILAGAGDIPAGGTTAKDGLTKIGAAWAAVYAATRRAPTAVLMGPANWGALLDAVDTTGRPLVTSDMPQNPAGLGDASAVVGSVRGLPVIVDTNIPTNLGTGSDEPIVVCNFRDALLFENQAAPAQIALTYPDVLVTDVSVYGFSSLAIRRPLAFQAISGIASGT